MSEASGIGSKSKRREIGIRLWWAVALAVTVPALAVVLVGRPMSRTAWGLVLCQTATAALVLTWLYYRVCSPLRRLERDLQDISQGRPLEPVDPTGPLELRLLQERAALLSAKLEQEHTRRVQSERSRQSMLADISHDLKTPITVIEGYAQALEQGLVTPGMERQYLRTITAKAAELDELINTFYEYSKLEHPEYALERQPADIFVFVRDWLAEKYAELDLAGFRLEADIPERHVTLSIDRQQLRRALENIVSNTVRYAGPGAGIYCRMTFDDRAVTILLGDDGPGIPKALRPDLFEPFAVGEQARGQKGSGLGLAITRKILEAHGGTITLADRPEPPCRTQFIINLPRG